MVHKALNTPTPCPPARVCGSILCNPCTWLPSFIRFQYIYLNTRAHTTPCKPTGDTPCFLCLQALSALFPLPDTCSFPLPSPPHCHARIRYITPLVIPQSVNTPRCVVLMSVCLPHSPWKLPQGRKVTLHCIQINYLGLGAQCRFLHLTTRRLFNVFLGYLLGNLLKKKSLENQHLLGTECFCPSKCACWSLTSIVIIWRWY